MTTVSGFLIVPWLVFLADWSVRWGLILAALALWFALRPPKQAAIRHSVCTAALAAGLLLPIMPRWGSLTIPWPASTAGAAMTLPSLQRPGLETTPERGLEPVARAEARPASPDHASQRATAVGPARSPREWSLILGREAWRFTAWLLAVIWIVAVLVSSVRLLGGWLLLTRLRKGSINVDETSRSLMDECRKILRLARRTELAAHPAVASPVTLGGLRPLILVPLDWDAWAESDRRACLSHELAHLIKHDDWAKLVQELVRIPLFFHPLVRWLLARLDRERELLCDEAVVALGVDPVAYARLLLDLARRPVRLVPAGVSSLPSWLPFLDRGTVAARIERLLEEDMARTLSPPFPRRLFILGVAALAAAVGFGSLRVRAVQASGPMRVNPEPAKVQPPRSPVRIIRGKVIDPENKPIPDAILVGGLDDVGERNHQVLTTDQEGRFSWEVPPGRVSLSLYAQSPGRAPQSWTRWLDANKSVDEIALRLRNMTPEPFTAVLVDGGNNPLAGATVRVQMSAKTSEFKQAEGMTSRMVAFTRYPREILTGSPLEHLFVTTTGDRGSFSFLTFPPDSWLKLEVTTRDGHEMRVRARPRSSENIDTMMDGQGFVSAPSGQVTYLAISRAARVQGRVSTKLQGVNVDGIRVWFRGSQVRQDRWTPAPNFSGSVRTDADGRFAIDGLDEGTVKIGVVMEDHDKLPWIYRVGVVVEGHDKGPLTDRAAEHVELRTGRTTGVQIELIRGVEVTGKVILQGTGQPVEGVRIAVRGPLSPWEKSLDTSGTTDPGGRFHYRLPPGTTSFYLADDLPEYTIVSEQESIRTVTIPDGVAAIEIPPIVLVRRNQPGT